MKRVPITQNGPLFYCNHVTHTYTAAAGRFMAYAIVMGQESQWTKPDIITPPKTNIFVPENRLMVGIIGTIYVLE